MIVIIDFGSQTTHLISRRLREISVETIIVEPEEYFEKTKNFLVNGIILSGGPGDAYKKDALTINPKILAMHIPVLGICYGEQVIAEILGGKVLPGKKKEFGPAEIHITSESPLFNFCHPDPELVEGEGSRKNMDSSVTPQNDIDKINVWMNHGDEVGKIPSGFHVIGNTDTIPYAAIADESRKIYGIQFHPEVVHTQFGLQILKNFSIICGLKPKDQPITKSFVDQQILDIKESVGKKQVIGALSGGVDSSIACLMVHRAIGDQFTAIYIDSGLMREGETEELKKVFADSYKMKVLIIDAQSEFIRNLEGVTNPEKKRKIIGKTFIDVLEREAKKLNATFLVQGTIYPDVIESAGTKHAKNIKSHHNVGGLPKHLNVILLEPLRNFYKDEVRAIGTLLDLPKEITHRHPFPGPGLAIRIIGEVTPDKIKIVKTADKIVRDEIHRAKLDDNLWQVFAVFTGIKTTGVRGDNRAYGETIAVRAVESLDVMSSNFAKLDWNLLEKISVRIVTEVTEVNRVVYDITNKPPGTVEWE